MRVFAKTVLTHRFLKESIRFIQVAGEQSMVKRSTKKKVETQVKEKGNSVANRLKVPVSQGQSVQLPETVSVLQEHFEQQPVFSSADEAVAWWTGKIAERMESDPKERVLMQEFLQVLVETDPALQAQLLQEIRPKK